MATDPSSQSLWKVSHMSESKETEARCALHCCRLVQCSCMHVYASRICIVRRQCVSVFRLWEMLRVLRLNGIQSKIVNDYPQQKKRHNFTNTTILYKYYNPQTLVPSAVVSSPSPEFVERSSCSSTIESLSYDSGKP